MNQLKKCSECNMLNIGDECPKRCDGTNFHVTPKSKKVKLYVCKRGFEPTVKTVLFRKF